MAESLKRVKQIDKRHEFIVFGYNHQTEKQYSLLHIPSMISNLCLEFYFQENYFENGSGNLEISGW